MLCLIVSLAGSLRLAADYPVASHRYLADPAVLVHEGRVYFYCSNDDENAVEGGYSMKSFVCISSSDLKNWTDHGVVFEVPEDAHWASHAWAPSVVKRNGHIYLYFGNNASGIGVAVADSPLGPFTDPIGGYLVSHQTPGASGEDMWLFDPAAFIDDDGQAYLYFGGNGESNVRVIRLNEDMISVDGTAQSITAPGFFEAAWLNKRDGTYYFSYSTNPSNGMRIDYMTSDDPMSDFSYAGVVAGQPPNNNNNNHHGIFEFEGRWYHVFHNRYVSGQAGISTTYKRNLGLEPLYFNEDGSIQEVSYGRDDLEQVAYVDPFVMVEGECFASQSGVEVASCSEDGMALVELADGDWVQVRGVDFDHGAVGFEARVASILAGRVEVYLDSMDGEPMAACALDSTSGLEAWYSVESAVDASASAGVHDVFLKFASDADGDFMALNSWQFRFEQVSPVTLLQVQSAGDAQVQLVWEASPEAVSYRVQRSSQSGGPFELLGSVEDAQYLDTFELVNGETYFYRVLAVGSTGVESASEAVEAKPVQLFEAWIAEQIGEGADPLLLERTADPDADGFSNLLEYFAGTDPELEESLKPFELVREGTSTVSLFLRESKNLSGLAGAIESSTDLASWISLDELPLGSEEVDGAVIHHWLLSVEPEKRCFYRLRLEEE